MELTGFPLPHCFFLLFSSFLPISFSLSLALSYFFITGTPPTAAITYWANSVGPDDQTHAPYFLAGIYIPRRERWLILFTRADDGTRNFFCVYVMADFCFLFWLNSKLPVSASFRLGDPTNGRCFVRVRPKNYWARFSSWSYYRSRAELNSRPVDQDAPISFLRGSRSTRWGDKLPSICRTSADLSIRTDDSS